MATLPYGVAVYDGVAPSALCRQLITHFDATPKKAIDHKIDGKPEPFEYLEVDEENIRSHIAIHEVYRRISRYVDRYLDEHIASPEFRSQLKAGIYSLDPRMKKYSVGGDFPSHTDDSSIIAQSRRFAYILYLNDDFTGGHTVFRSGTAEVARIVPAEGALAVFAVHPVFMHEGAPITSGSKYIFNGFVETMVSQARAAQEGSTASKLDVVKIELAMNVAKLSRAAEKVFGKR